MKKSIFEEKSITVNGFYLSRVTARKTCDYMRALNNNPWRAYYDIYEAYKKPSVYKVYAWRNCIELCKAFNGYDLKITGHNCMSFTVVFKFIHPIHGNVCCAWITKDNNRYCDL